MAYQFKAIEKDKQTYVADNEKIKSANSAFGSYEIGRPTHIERVEKIEDLPKIKLEEIKPREVNKFDTIKNETLKASILEVGLINPVSLLKGDGTYTIISGHRRYDAYKSILDDLLQERRSGVNTPELNRKIDFYSSIPSIVYEQVKEGSPLLGTDKKYITADQEEKIYEASNLETRQISRKDLQKHILYFYKMVKENDQFRTELLNQSNTGAKRKSKKLNVPKVLSTIITKDPGFSVAPSYIWSIVTLIEDKDKFPEYHEKVMERIDSGEKVKPAYNDYFMAVKIHDDEGRDSEEKRYYLERILSGNEPVKNIYNEYFGLEENSSKVRSIRASDRDEITKIFTSATDMNSLYNMLKNGGFLNQIEAYEV